MITPPMAIRPIDPAGAEVLAALLADALPFVRVRRLAGDQRAAILAERIETVLREVNRRENESGNSGRNRVD